MDFLTMGSLHKFTITVDGQQVGQFYHIKGMSLKERRDLADEYAKYNFISSSGVKVFPIENDGKLGNQRVIPHLGKVS